MCTFGIGPQNPVNYCAGWCMRACLGLFLLPPPTSEVTKPPLLTNRCQTHTWEEKESLAFTSNTQKMNKSRWQYSILKNVLKNFGLISKDDDNILTSSNCLTSVKLQFYSICNQQTNNTLTSPTKSYNLEPRYKPGYLKSNPRWKP